MASHLAVRAIEDAVKHGKAIVKFLSANDVGATRSHQSGFLLPKGAWELYSPHAPKKGQNLKSMVTVLWPNGSTTQSCVTWYGRAKSEYRLTGGFDSEFPYIDSDSVGSLLVLVPVDHANFIAYVLDTDDDIADVQAALGLEIIEVWGVYHPAGMVQPETENQCIDRQFREFAARVEGWPRTGAISEATRTALQQCIRGYIRNTADAKLVDYMEKEFQLFKLVERQLCGPEIHRVFGSVDDFVRTASSIMNRRKSRAGWSLENHVASLLTEAGVPFAPRASEIDGEPDILIPSVDAYNDKSFPVERLCMVGVKTTCKDRWRQVLKEGKRIPSKHILTMQRGISAKQLLEMKTANVTLIVPEALQKHYPEVPGVKLVRVAEFIEWAGKISKV